MFHEKIMPKIIYYLQEKSNLLIWLTPIHIGMQLIV